MDPINMFDTSRQDQGATVQPPQTGVQKCAMHDAPQRPLKPALWRGWRRRCPCCGSGPMMKGYLAVRDTCPVCEEELFHQRADDGPAYLTILIVGHVLAPVLLAVFVAFRPDPITLATVFSVAAIAMSLYLLPRLKGAMVAFQWSRRMHGFSSAGTAAEGKRLPDGQKRAT